MKREKGSVQEGEGLVEKHLGEIVPGTCRTISCPVQTFRKKVDILNCSRGVSALCHMVNIGTFMNSI